MEGKTVVITGANSGIGKAAAKAIAKQGARVAITARSRDKGEAAQREIVQAAGHDRVDLYLADFAKLDDVRRLAAELDAAYPRIDVLLNNAGLMLTDRSVTPDGYETTFQVNHLAPFLLTNLLLDKLKKSAPSRIVNVSSDMHKFVKGIDLDDVMGEKRYVGRDAYAISKGANVLFTHALEERLADTGVTVYALHPGVVNTGFASDGDTRGPFSMALQLFRPFFRTPEKGAETSVYLATAPDVEKLHGKYFADKKVKKTAPWVGSRDTAERLWTISEKLTGLA